LGSLNEEPDKKGEKIVFLRYQCVCVCVAVFSDVRRWNSDASRCLSGRRWRRLGEMWTQRQTAG